ncbi:MAG: type II toxin-antitoxin system RelE/ParE family toxin [Desulfarculales bacterium]|nr:type II toxin-antitoxin system RelE/ParE family toxin [Desulfarculales bacterium]
MAMIKTWSCQDTQEFFYTGNSRRFAAVARIAMRRLYILEAATGLNDLLVPPGNRLEALKGKRQGQYSVRINDRWRICFIWQEGHAYEVEITDYH